MHFCKQNYTFNPISSFCSFPVGICWNLWHSSTCGLKTCLKGSIFDQDTQTALGDDGTVTNWANMVRELCSQDLPANYQQLGSFDNNRYPTTVLSWHWILWVQKLRSMSDKDHHLDGWFLELRKPIFERLSNRDLLERCVAPVWFNFNLQCTLLSITCIQYTLF